MSRVFAAMSGGVDSSVAAALLKAAGHEVVGVSMHLWCEEKQGSGAQKRPCCSLEDIHDAREVCRLLDIPHYVVNLENEFLEWVVSYFVSEYGRGRTPNPCLACNQHIKFNLLLNRVRALGGDYLATGHYARIHTSGTGVPACGGSTSGSTGVPACGGGAGILGGAGVPACAGGEDKGPPKLALLKATDETKDQSYVLYTLGQEELAHVLFPLGEYTKVQVRQMAKEHGLPVAAKPDSQEICFVPETSYSAFIGGRIPASPGEIVDRRGRVLGRHRGLCHYTIGQRKGLGISSDRPIYVLSLDAEANRVTVGEDQDLFETTLFAGRLNWVAGRPPRTPCAIAAKIRYKAPPAAATLFLQDENARVEFQTPQRAITPGQAVVFYQGDVVLGGGVIEESSQ
ncbi:MAG: tRNA-specific 2-thiouridylase [Chloroflexi bacterium]|nr:tRNA-specific 2-thiouridylase [Chloroflexota bacterium]